MTKPLIYVADAYSVKLTGIAKKNIEAWNLNGRIVCECKQCGRQWQPLLMPGGRFHPGWWKCPYGYGCSDL